MIDEIVLEGLKKRHKDLNPLVFHRSFEKSETATELFDILETVPNCPFLWDDINKKWSTVSDFLCLNKAKLILK
jgi:hypothetical protein